MENKNSYIPDENISVDEITLPEIPDLPSVDDIKMPEQVDSFENTVSADAPAVDRTKIPVEEATAAATAPRFIPGTNIPAGRQTLITKTAYRPPVQQVSQTATQTAPAPQPMVQPVSHTNIPAENAVQTVPDPKIPEAPQYKTVPQAANIPQSNPVPVPNISADQAASQYLPVPTATSPTSAQIPDAQPYYNFTANTSTKSKATAAILAFFLGWLGVHNFYLGYIGKAVTQLLISVLSCFCGSFITFIWAIIEGILILNGTINTDKNGNFLA